MRIVFLLVVLVCIMAYVRSQQPATWNSWMTAVGMTSLAVPSGAADSNATDASVDSAAPPAPPRTIPVGGLVKEGDFSSGGLNWEGDGGSGPGGKGVEVKLDPSNWTRIYQTFPGDQRTHYSIEVTYRLSPGLTVSQNPSDYLGIGKRINVPGFENFYAMNGSPGDFYGTIGDPNATGMSMEVYQPALRSSQVMDYRHTYPPIPPNGNVTFALAYPPGTGTVTLLTVYVMSQ